MDTALKILLVCGFVCVILSFVMKRPPKQLAYVEAAFFAVYEILFIIFHPLIGVICCISLGFLVYYFYADDQKLNSISNFQIYTTFILVAFSFVYEVVETFAGRLF